MAKELSCVREFVYPFRFSVDAINGLILMKFIYLISYKTSVVVG